MGPPLERYGAILTGAASARYLLCRSVAVELSEEEPLDLLWSVHDEKMAELRERMSRPGSAPIAKKVNLLTVKRRIAEMMLRECRLCEHDCGVDRSSGQRGRCGVAEAKVACDFVHHGEERVLVPSYTVFFPGCNLECAFCQNHDISTDPRSGSVISSGDMASRIERLGGKDADRSQEIRNVNWVGGEPTPNLPFILGVLEHASANAPQVWNSNMYLTEKAMKLLDGTMDVYLTDLKFGNDECARRLAGAGDYLRITARNHRLAAAQGEVIVRHLMLPGHLECCTLPVLDWLADNMSGALINIMDQYRPEHRAWEHPELRRRLSPKDHRVAVEYAREKGLDICAD
jgi:putative pyruvate formate lyase activating enzyme